MPGAGDLPADEFSAVLDSPATDFPLFAPPSEPITDTKYAIGLHAAGLVRDGGTLQIGIGQVGDALAQGLIVRHRDNAQFREIMRRLSPATHGSRRWKPDRSRRASTASARCCSRLSRLIDAGILKREVDGVVLHGAFFLGPKSFYRALREMTPEQLARIQMMPVSFTNELYGDEEAKRRARVDARFVNNAMMATLMGAVVSDGLENGQVVSGVGGQYNFVAQAFALAGARSILTLEATRAGRRQAAIQHPLELRPRDHSAASARYRRHRIRRRRSQGKIRCRRDRGDAAGRGFALSRRTDAAGQGRRQAAEELSRSRPRIARICRSGSQPR